MSVLAGPTEDSAKHILPEQEYVTDMETCEFTYKWTIKKFNYDYDHFPRENEWMSYIARTTLLQSSDKYLQNDELKVSCTMTISKEQKKNPGVISIFNLTPQLSEDLKKLLSNEQSADVTIKVGEKSFRVIKGILAARSPVFAAMFDHEQYKENKNSEVVIEDIEEDVFTEFLHYIYTDDTKNVNKMPMELLEVAEKYQVDRLKNICERIICGTINADNVTSVLIFSDKFNVGQLNKKCLEFIKTNLRAVLSKDSFQAYKKTHPEVFINVLASVAGIN
ncbi:speckle-type POZ protein B-like [Aphidius gifuensis]|uniref:speckle-type POZ protein B-like n=1 Tax=Aphidius gifuensis TaxID=684658 RepID=UPI001CDC5160|nr:speckle-type POZ protein B-like [Aphidius gifuensis]